MGGFLKEPNIERSIQSGQLSRPRHNLTYSSCQLQGWPRFMEDFLLISTGNVLGMSTFALFDGFSGPEISEYLMRNFEKKFSQVAARTSSVSAVLRESLRELDHQLSDEKRQKELIANSKNQNEHREHLASCAIVLVVSESRVFCANLGDSRCVMVKDGELCNLSYDHTPQDPEQKKRFASSKIKIINNRIEGTVGFTRCVGLLKYKKYTPCEPEIISEELGSSGFIVMGTRGLWQSIEQDTLLQRISEASLDEKCSATSRILLQTLAKTPYKESKGVSNMSIIALRYSLKDS